MKKALLPIVAAVLLLACQVPREAFADCPDYKLRCQDGSWHGPWGTCWKWSDFMCVPCQDHGTTCDDHGGPQCVWLSSSMADIALAYLCKYLHIPNDKCVVCLN